MQLDTLTILNYKNIAEARLEFAPGVNCLIGNNGMGKTNVLDAVYYLSLCRSSMGQPDTSVIRHGEPYMMLQGHYTRREGDEDITIALQRGKRKVVRRAGKEYQRLSQHIGLLPLVMISPMDWDLIRGAGEERRKLMNQIIAQGDAEYLDAIIRYGKAVEQRNSMIRHEMRDPLLYETVEQVMCTTARVVHEARKRWIEAFTPIFLNYYQAVAGNQEHVQLRYESALNDATLEQVLAANRERDMAIGYTTHGVHRDDIELLLDAHSMRRNGSQGQCKTYTIALRLAQFDFIKASNPTTPILLLDDIFDKLDATRVERIVDIVAGEQFGQIFITDTNRTHLDSIVTRLQGDHRMFDVVDGKVQPLQAATTACDNDETNPS
ncbi:MAG: DNA replication and repair protein RecF [Muribaculaceae bacterium]|nr:DNA replication and repair protein RecF [Muribaculaceae bacterium]